MTGIKVLIVAVLLVFYSVRPNEGLIHDGLAKIFGGYKNARIMQLLNQLCSSSQDIDSVQRDACYGCFFMATNQPPGYPVLLSMAACADVYLNNTSYGHCQAYLRNATSTVNSKTSPNKIYCTFLECIRQVNKNALIRECVDEARQILPFLTGTNVGLAQLFVNTTACILAKTRCGMPNPITGVFQEDELTSKLHVPAVHAIVVNTDYEINIVQLPFSSAALDECAKYRNTEQATWPGVQC